MSTASGLGALYPFLYGESGGLEQVLEAVRRSTIDKVAEIGELRMRCSHELGEALAACARAMANAFAAGGRLFAFGNGGSSTDAQALAATFLCPPDGVRPLPALSLTNDIALVTALGNDVGFDVVFARQIAAHGRPGDIAVGLSTSGNSGNLLRAFEEASRRGLVTVGLAGSDGGAMAHAGTIEHLLVVPSSSVHRIQEAQTTVYHVLWEITHALLGKEA